ncbi:FAD-binding protein [Desulfoprunum benzoelyticum]|uniref:Glycolate oxidase n=1 Tax=Desulfoprunum benzoelyticum TaxID=1506996 RepID=A0A840UQL0_9BACT|nr:FAD-linked oxidase C-terminal domain-containing protein [Desulfoprunum benzoelyticum]MBB5347126.1 glycolate oxidase [Desulfoprunum benzoelyticum]MBM9531241.1 FAD-binding protein [Desulfoprunum benzoelyticum]
MNPIIIKKISAIVGPAFCTTRREDLHCYSFDGAGKIFLPEAVAFPATTAEVAAIMRLASEYGFPVVPRGAGTGMTGGSVPIRGGLVLALSRMNHIVEIDAGNQIAIVEPGVITGDLQQAVRKFGLFYPPDPASLKFCTIGGNAAECAGGPSAVKYGVTKDFVIGLEAVLASGDIVTAGTRTEKGVTGYDLTRLFIGSEGTLGIITRLILRLLPLPEHKETFLVTSTSLASTTALVARILNSNIRPCTLEYMDRTAIRVVTDRLSTPPPPGTEALLLIELDGDRDTVDHQTARLKALLATEPDCHCHHAASQTEVDELWQARRSISPATFNLSPHKISEDVAVPRTRIPDLVAFTERLSAELGLTILTFGHAGDGNIHVNIMLDKDDPEQLRRGESAKERLFRQAIALGGTLSGEHGIGLSKALFLALELNDATIRLMKDLKQLFDPHNILNPGKIFPEGVV